MPPNSTWEEDASQPLSDAGSSSILSIPRLVDASPQSPSPTPLSGSSSIIIWLLCVFGGVHRRSLAARGLSLGSEQGLPSNCGAQASQGTGFSGLEGARVSGVAALGL